MPSLAFMTPHNNMGLEMTRGDIDIAKYWVLQTESTVKQTIGRM